ncbi:hypothetical protein [Anaeromassilibacillus senegalensis]|uniref:hypothetical protein n=1 Tax=Anaeromassilibacillus senegalensis TaxID=1673717 RepID=UPI0012B51D73|nr:hypothetical protein [Anaeromassilibacillus senegalensis]
MKSNIKFSMSLSQELVKKIDGLKQKEFCGQTNNEVFLQLISLGLEKAEEMQEKM